MEPTRARDLDGTTRRSPRAEPLLVTCTRCEKLHAAAPLEFNPVCAICAAQRDTMRRLGMRGSFPLDHEAIAAELTRRSPGNYALGYLEDDRFVVFFVGRSDSDLERRLHDWVRTPARYERYAPSGMAAWRSRRRGASPLDTPALGRVGSADSCYTHFAYSYAASPTAAFEKELENYDDFGGQAGLDNEQAPPHRHPDAGDDPAQRL